MASVREDILSEIKATLVAALVGSGGYSTNVAGRVFIMGRDTFSAPAHPYIQISQPDETFSEESTLAGLQVVPVNAVIEIGLFMHGLPDGTATLSTLLSNALADLQKALLADRTRGGKAIMTSIVSTATESNLETEPHGFAGVAILVFYRFQASDPTVPR